MLNISKQIFKYIMSIRIATFDIGKKNFAFYAEDVSAAILKDLNKKYKSLPVAKRRRVKGPMNTDIENILHTLCMSGKRVENGMGVFDIRDDKNSNELDIQTRLNLFSLLKSYEWLWDKCDIIVIEQQYFNITSRGNRGQGSGANVDAIKLAECCLCYFLTMYHSFKEICYFGSMYKTQILGAPDKLTKDQRKKWSVEKGIDILTKRGDTFAIDLINNYKNAKGKKQKQDDVFDCIIMCQAYKFRTMIMN